MEEFRRLEREAREPGEGFGRLTNLPRAFWTQNLCRQAVSNSSNNRRMKTVLLLIAFVLASIHFA